VKRVSIKEPILFILFSLCWLLGVARSSSAEQLKAVQHAALDNGLEILVMENHAVPLVTVCIAFRGGAMAQTPETAGLFHLYEHMMFNGNDKYPN